MRHLASVGYKKLSISARRKEELEKIAKQAEENGATDVLVLPRDLSNVEAAKDVVVETVKHFGSMSGSVGKSIFIHFFV